MSLPSPLPTLRLATRGSRLALIQAESVAALLRRRLPELAVEIVTAVTHGDLRRDVPLAELAAPDGVFTRGVESELLEGRADFAVHSLKDVPTQTDPRLSLAAFPARADARDVCVTRDATTFAQLQPGARIGTSSPRRAAQARGLRPDLELVSVRGNVDTRLRKLAEGELDALLLAAAGLKRLGHLDEAAELLDVERFTPAVGQGALAVQCRADDETTRELLAAIDDPVTRAAVTAERVFLRAIGGGCQAPIAGYAEVEGPRLTLRGFIAAPDGSEARCGQLEGAADRPAEVGQALAKQLLAAAGPRFRAEVAGHG